MKRNAIRSAAVLAVLWGAPIAFAGAQEASFDRPGKGVAQLIEYAKDNIEVPVVAAPARSIGANTELRKRVNVLRQAVVSMKNLLQGASAAAKQEFLESLQLVDGRVASVSTKSLRAELGAERVAVILLAINPPAEGVPGDPDQTKVKKLAADSHTLALCGEHVCNDTACYYDGSSKYCVDSPGSNCYSSCK